MVFSLGNEQYGKWCKNSLPCRRALIIASPRLSRIRTPSLASSHICLISHSLPLDLETASTILKHDGCLAISLTLSVCGSLKARFFPRLTRAVCTRRIACSPLTLLDPILSELDIAIVDARYALGVVWNTMNMRKHHVEQATQTLISKSDRCCSSVAWFPRI